jgi:predicted DNA-binding transcriptional regulator YafY
MITNRRTECVVNGMGNMHRILWFDEQVRFGKYPNSSHLAEHFEISVRQACRDIEYLTNSLRAPLVYNPKRRGYQYEDRTYVLPALMLTASDIQVIQDIIRHLEQTAALFGATSFSEKAVGLLQNIISHSSYET